MERNPSHRMFEIACLLAGAMQLCFKYRGSVTSWVRSEVHNALVGGSPASKHLTGEAVDIVWDSLTGQPQSTHSEVAPPLEDLQREARSFGARVFRELTHDHIEVAR